MVKKLFLSLIITTIYNITYGQTYNSFYGSIVSNVSSTNIVNDLTTFENYGVKEVGTIALTNAENWITSHYTTLGYTNIELQEFTYSAGTSNNIIVTKIGTVYPDTYVIVDAHYDTIQGTGTNDNGSGTVLLMELARLLKNVNTEYSIKFIHFSGEEDGLVGSQYYVNNTVNPENIDIRVVFNIDEVGGVNGLTNNIIVCEEDRSNPPQNNSESSVFTTILANCIELYSTLDTEISFAYSSDYIPFENNGEIITGLYEKNESPYAHTTNDLLVNMDANYLFEVTKGALGALMEFSVASEVLAVDDFPISSSILIYPNPNKGVFNIKLDPSISNDVDFKIYDILGKLVYKQILKLRLTQINLSHLGDGVYLSVIESNGSKITKKIIID
ncbi:M28 family peptidase [Winogradskyella sp.]|uniref:M28 family peptidase n=1 Tax=Winogradskyella sp. TaxID=1883156 RepID=UPI0025F7D680|nr:M28 family peptidase [Winogradskyella sp.]